MAFVETGDTNTKRRPVGSNNKPRVFSVEQRGSVMHYERVVLSALYTVQNEAYALRRDAEAREIISPYLPRDLGASTFLPTMEREFDWELPLERAERAQTDLEEAGFRTRLRRVETSL
jgi:hypothetical protein